MKQLSVLVLYGGESSEHDVSINSARNVVNAVDTQRFDISLCYIDRDGRWWLLDEWHDTPDEHRSVELLAAPGKKSLVTVPGNKELLFDVMYPVLHGKMGEDGSVQGMARLLHIPIVGCDAESSAICMNKDVTKRLLALANIPVVPWVVARAGYDEASTTQLAQDLSSAGPWFVKPARAGSSVGVSKVDDLAVLPHAVDMALEHDTAALIEIAVQGRELEVAVIGNPPHHHATGIGEILPGNDFYDYDDKYASNSTSALVLDAHLSAELTETIKRYALDAYETLGCSGMARVDFLLSDDLTPYVNEINTLPGFTDISMYPKLWEQQGVSQTELVSRLIMHAVE